MMERSRLSKHDRALNTVTILPITIRGGNNNDNNSSLSGTLDTFVQVLSQLEFRCAKMDRSNSMFSFLEPKKNGKASNKKLEYSEKGCIYKRQ